jgi:hypothetical protein
VGSQVVWLSFLVGGLSTPLKNMSSSLKVSWDDEIPNIWKVIKHVPNHTKPETPGLAAASGGFRAFIEVLEIAG